MLFTYLVIHLVYLTARASVVFEDCVAGSEIDESESLLPPSEENIAIKLKDVWQKVLEDNAVNEVQPIEELTTLNIEAYTSFKNALPVVVEEFEHTTGAKPKSPQTIPTTMPSLNNSHRDWSAYDLQVVNIQGCGMRLPCFVTLGDRIPVNVRFYADFVSRHLDQDVTIEINFIQAKTPVTPEQCGTVMCPVRTDAETSFTSVMSVPTNVALNQRGYLQWRVYNEWGQRVLCYQVMVQTQNFLQKILRQYLALLDARLERLGISSSRDTFNTSQFFNSSFYFPNL